MRKLIASLTIIGALVPSLASAAWHVTDYDTASGNGSLSERFTSGQLEPRIVEVSTVAGEFKPDQYDMTKREIRKFVDQLLCSHGNAAKCQPRKDR